MCAVQSRALGIQGMKQHMNVRMAALWCSTAMFFSLGAYAQTATVADDSSSPAEVVITAQKRSSTVQETPISITAVSGDDLQTRWVYSVAGLGPGTPGVSLKR